MGNIFDPYPDNVTVNGKTYAIDLSFDNVLLAVDAAADPLLTQEDKVDAQAQLLIVNPPKNLQAAAEVLTAIFALFPKSKEQSSRRYMDFHQDAALIRSGFMRAYKMDLTRERPHFFQFMELLADLPRDTAFVRTVELRQRPLPEPNGKNAKEIAALQAAKRKVALEFSAEERERMFADSLKNAFSSMAGR